jgi:uncharacterized protein (TIGR02246 family)
MKTAVVASVIVMAAAGAVGAQKPAAGDEAAIAKVRSTFQSASMAQDAAALGKLYTPDGMELPPNAPALKGRAAIEAYHKGLAQQFMVHGVSIASTELHVTGDRAYDVGTYKQQLMPLKGGGVIDDHGKYIVLLKKDGGTWSITHAIYNSDLPLPAPPAKK